ncbi:unnamed protein product, partial [Polarella glacialis]
AVRPGHGVGSNSGSRVGLSARLSKRFLASFSPGRSGQTRIHRAVRTHTVAYPRVQQLR